MAIKLRWRKMGGGGLIWYSIVRHSNLAESEICHRVLCRVTPSSLRAIEIKTGRFNYPSDVIERLAYRTNLWCARDVRLARAIQRSRTINYPIILKELVKITNNYKKN